MLVQIFYLMFIFSYITQDNPINGMEVSLLNLILSEVCSSQLNLLWGWGLIFLYGKVFIQSFIIHAILFTLINSGCFGYEFKNKVYSILGKYPSLLYLIPFISYMLYITFIKYYIIFCDGDNIITIAVENGTITWIGSRIEELANQLGLAGVFAGIARFTSLILSTQKSLSAGPKIGMTLFTSFGNGAVFNMDNHNLNKMVNKNDSSTLEVSIDKGSLNFTSSPISVEDQTSLFISSENVSKLFGLNSHHANFSLFNRANDYFHITNNQTIYSTEEGKQLKIIELLYKTNPNWRDGFNPLSDGSSTNPNTADILIINSPLEGENIISELVRDNLVELLELDLSIHLCMVPLLCYIFILLTSKYIINGSKLDTIKNLPFGLSKDTMLIKYIIKIIKLWGATSLFWIYFGLISISFFVGASIQFHISVINQLNQF